MGEVDRRRRAAPGPGVGWRSRSDEGGAKVLVVGAGFGGLAVAKELEDAPVDVTIVDRHNFHTFLPLLYQVATAGLNPADVAYPVRGIFQSQPNVSFRHAEVSGVDWDERKVRFADGTDLAFDHLVVAAGSATNFFGVPGPTSTPSRCTRSPRRPSCATTCSSASRRPTATPS